MSVVFLNGVFCAPEEASVSVLDRGFLLGDGIYEVIPAYHGKLFRLTEHLERMQRSLDAIHLKNPHSFDQWNNLLSGLVEKNGGGNLSVYMQITRGVAKRDHAFPKDVRPTVFAMANVIGPLDPVIEQQGITALTVNDDRWQHCDIKSISLLPNVLLRQQAVEQGYAESILIRDGYVTEGAASNVFIVSDSVVITPPNGPFILPGVTRDLVLELAAANNIGHAERPISKGELLAADEVWLTSSTREILPVVRIGEHKIGIGCPGEMWKQLIVFYRKYKAGLAS